MSSARGFWKVAAILTAATVGDGVFALPYVFYRAGWLLCLTYIIVLGSIVIAAHVAYFKALEKVGEKERLLGLTKKYFGDGGFWVGFVAIILGLLLTLVAYLILGSQFIRLGFPNLPPHAPLVLFWLFIAAIVLLSDARVRELELLGILFTSIVIILIFFTAMPRIGFDGAPLANGEYAFLPFGAILFSLAGWTGVEPAYELRKWAQEKKQKKKDALPALAFGTVFAALLYMMFAAGILGGASRITPDTISGLGDWAAWKRYIIAALGLFAVATVSMPILREIKNSLEKDLRWNKTWTRCLIIFFPLASVALGLNNFLTVVGIVGGVFLSTQYLLIVSVGRRALTLSLAKKILLDTAAIIFLAAAIYQTASFIVR